VSVQETSGKVLTVWLCWPDESASLFHHQTHKGWRALIHTHGWQETHSVREQAREGGYKQWHMKVVVLGAGIIINTASIARTRASGHGGRRQPDAALGSSFASNAADLGQLLRGPGPTGTPLKALKWIQPGCAAAVSLTG
jgi:hypothetical protein